jgi:Zn-dependent protease with chaperone function
MATFFEQQDRARRHTRILVWLMALAVIGMALSIYALSFSIEQFAGSPSRTPLGPPTLFQPQLFLVCFCGTAAVVAIASALRVLSLRGGGAHVAEMLGGRLVSGNPRDPLERRLLNVVEEMAIASGVPVPQVFALDGEPGINAFAAGFSPDDAAVAVTRGSLEKLSRDELQGVIAHEFSHVLNGDMRLNMAMMGIVFGILWIALLGRFLVRTSVGGEQSSSDRRGSLGAAILLLGLGVYVIGLVGELFGKLIKAAVSREREFLADASAVQFTRNPQGIGGALKKIGGLDEGSSVKSVHAEEASHFFFGDFRPDIYNRLWVPGMFATHPPLGERILRIDPSFHGEFPKVGPGIAEPEDRPAAQVAAFAKAGGRAAEPRTVAPHTVVSQVGTVGGRGVDTSRRLVDSLPSPLRDGAENPFAACAIAYALILSDEESVREAQIARIDALSGMRLRAETLRLHPYVRALARRDRLPLVSLLAPALRRLSRQQGTAFMDTVQAVIDADHAESIFEYVIGQTLRTRLAEEGIAQQRSRVRHFALEDVRSELELLLSLLAHAGDADGRSAPDAFAAGASRLPDIQITFLPESPRLLFGLGVALEEFAALAPALRAQVVDACAHTVLADRRVTDDEETLLRAVCDALGSPLPQFEDGVAA